MRPKYFGPKGGRLSFADLNLWKNYPQAQIFLHYLVALWRVYLWLKNEPGLITGIGEIPVAVVGADQSSSSVGLTFGLDFTPLKRWFPGMFLHFSIALYRPYLWLKDEVISFDKNFLIRRKPILRQCDRSTLVQRAGGYPLLTWTYEKIIHRLKFFCII